MKQDAFKNFFQIATQVHNLMIDYEFAHKQCHKLGRVECNVLEFLDNIDRRANMKEIAQNIDVSHSRTTHLIDSLIEKGYVRRITCENDRRVYYALITEAGRIILEKCKKQRIVLYDDFMKSFPEEKQQEIFESFENWKQILLKIKTDMQGKNKAQQAS